MQNDSFLRNTETRVATAIERANSLSASSLRHSGSAGGLGQKKRGRSTDSNGSRRPHGKVRGAGHPPPGARDASPAARAHSPGRSHGHAGLLMEHRGDGVGTAAAALQLGSSGGLSLEPASFQ